MHNPEPATTYHMSAYFKENLNPQFLFPLLFSFKCQSHKKKKVNPEDR